MTSYELIELYDEVLIDINKLKPYSDDIIDLLKLVDISIDFIIDEILKYGLSSSSTMSNVLDKRKEIIEKVTNFANNFDMLKNHSGLIEVRQKIETKKQMPSFKNFENEINNILLLLDIYSVTTQDIYEYIKSKDHSLLIKMFKSLKNASNKYNEIINEYRKLKEFVVLLEDASKEEATENEEEMYLHFYNEESNFDSYLEHFSSLLIIYNELRSILKSNIELKVIKIESGSFLGKLLGDKNIISLLTEILQKCFDLIFKKFTFEGILTRKKDILDFLKEELNIIEKCKTLGIEIGDENREIINKTLAIVSGEVIKLASKSTKIRINDQILNIEETISEKYLLENKTSLIEEHQK